MSSASTVKPLPLVALASATAAIALLLLLRDFISNLDDTLVFLLIGGGLVACLLMIQPVKLLWFTSVLTLVVAGSMRFFAPQLHHIWWLAYGCAFLLFVPALAYAARGSPRPPQARSLLMASSLGAFVLVAAASTVMALPPIPQLLAATKSLIMYAGVWAVLAAVPVPPRSLAAWLKGLLLIGAVQWLPAVYQYLFVRTMRIEEGLGTVSAADSVVGTFGGNPESGGLTAVLALYLVACLVTVLAMHRGGAIPKRRAVLLLPLLGAPLLLMEVKVFFFYLPVSLLVLYRQEVMRRPFAFLAGGVLTLIVMGGALLAYQALHWSVRGGDLEENVRSSFAYSFQSIAGYETAQEGALTRRGVLEYWWREHESGSTLHMLIGHGLGSARTQGQVLGEAAREHYPSNIDRTGIAMMLWEFGVLGVAALMGLGLGAFLKAGRLARSARLEPWQQALAAGLQAIIPLFFMSMLYRNDLPYAGPAMFMAMGTFGLLAWLGKQRRPPAPA